MIPKLQDFLSLVGRILLATLFLPSGISKLTSFANTVSYIKAAGMPMPEVAAVIALTVEILGGFALIPGIGTRFAAIVLAVFTLVASFYFHNYWAVPAGQQLVMQLLFFKNIAVVGGLLTVATWGPGKWSLDALYNRD